MDLFEERAEATMQRLDQFLVVLFDAFDAIALKFEEEPRFAALE